MYKTLITTLIIGGLMLPFASKASTVQTGDLIKGESFSSVYYLASDGKRWVFPNEDVYFSWYNSFDGVKTISNEDLASYPLGKNITIRPGMKLVKIQTDPKVYAIAPTKELRWVKTEAIAEALYGPKWAKNVVDIPDTFFTSYKIGRAIEEKLDFAPTQGTEPNGMENGVRRMVWAFNNIDEMLRADKIQVDPMKRCMTFNYEKCKEETGMGLYDPRLTPDYRFVQFNLFNDIPTINEMKDITIFNFQNSNPSLGGVIGQ